VNVTALLAATTGIGVAALFPRSVAGSAALTLGGLTAVLVAINRTIACGAGVVFIANLLVRWTSNGWLVRQL
jgi:hypothetical protein